MPLIVMTGIPASGKTRRALELKNFFEDQGKEVHLVSESDQMKKANFEKNSAFSNAREKHIRGLLKSEVLKLITPQNVVILDALNYIKGYRYELYCGTKANKSTQCTVHAEIDRDQAWSFNENRPESTEKYNREVFDELLMRYEEPEGKNRWDSPLFVVFPSQHLDKAAIATCLFDKAPPPPNMSTQNPPLCETNYLQNLDRITRRVVDALIHLKHSGTRGVVKVDGYEDLSVDVSSVTADQLIDLRRQFITYSKTHAPDSEHIAQLFVHYLNTSLQ